MRSLLTAVAFAIVFSACQSSPTTTTSPTRDAEKEHPDAYIKVNYEVSKNLVGKKIVSGAVINTGKYLTYKTVTLKIDSYKKGDVTSVNYTVPEPVAPGEQQSFRYKPEGNPERVKVSVAAASAD